MPTSISAPNVVDMAYHFTTNGNLEYRTDNRTTQEERFTYDGLNRLINWKIYQNGGFAKENSHVYDPTTGNITTRTNFDISKSMAYGGNRSDGSAIGPHALATIAGSPSDISSDELTVTYTDFKKIKTLTEGSKTYSISYGVDDQRRVSVQTVNGVTATRYYVGNYEEVITGSVIKKIHYLSGAIFIQETNQPDKFYYSYADYQGSLIATVDESGNIVKYAYDPWGVRRNPDNWTQRDTRTTWIVNRGYTGHEHLDAFGIINMNGRVYDSATGMFFSPDPYVQAPGNWVNYNRYGYCMNNPLKYTDPSGEFWWLIAGAIINTALNYASAAKANNWDWNFTHWNNNSFVLGYSQGGAFASFSFDGNNYTNIGAGYNGVTMGSTRNGVTTMQGINYIPVDFNQIVRQREAEGINSSSNANGYDYDPHKFDNELVGSVKPYNKIINKVGAFINYGPSAGYDPDYGLMTGVEVHVTYWANEKEPMPNAYWVQYITTNQPGSGREYNLMTKVNGNMYSYFDDSQSGGNRRYYSWSRMKEQNDRGYAIDFDDLPRRNLYPDKNTNWSANLYLINEGHAVMRLSYGWTTNYFGYAVPRPLRYYVFPKYR